MSTEADELRRGIRELFERRRRGDVRDKDFLQRLADASVSLSRAVVTLRLEPGERIVAEHHLAHSHFTFTQSILREPEQAMASFFASERRLIRVSSTMLPDRPFSCDEADQTTIEELPYDHVQQIRQHKQWRWSEAVTGLVIMFMAFVLGDVLAITGPMLMLLGIAGAAHGLLFPTCSAEVVARDGAVSEPFVLHGLRRRGARSILSTIRGALEQRRAREPQNQTCPMELGRATEGHGGH
jgi:hypothetical protein